MVFISSATPIALDCVPCGKGKPPHHSTKPHKPPSGKPPTTHPPTVRPPIVRPPVVRPPIVRPPVVNPPITIPPIVKPPITIPPVVTPPIVKPPITIPPVVTPPVLNPPSGGKPGAPCPPPPFVPAPAPTCPIDALKLGACVDLLGGLVHIGLGDPVVNQCCPILAGLVELEAAVFAYYLWQDSSSWLHVFDLSFSRSRFRGDESIDEVVMRGCRFVKNSLLFGVLKEIFDCFD
ncbi:hypothetical protein L6452_21814 [Arctium lappa]|uniref:Uncharacterized protein n=1 Tax=Arctium lappa TaxID=4217 RepID=A0ACB9AX79_ARCLA|nr:hypothetical protein L6452_21814 [Arctium lappa]